MPSPSRPEKSLGSPETRVTDSTETIRGLSGEQVLLPLSLQPAATPFGVAFGPLNLNSPPGGLEVSCFVEGAYQTRQKAPAVLRPLRFV